MQTNIVLCGVGGQGILSISIALDLAAQQLGWHFKQAEVHGMSQRGGEVVSHLRYSPEPIHSEVIPRGTATLVLSIEPLEALRYIEWLGPDGAVVSSSDPFVNFASYPDLEVVLGAIAAQPVHVLVPADRLARELGSARAANMVLLGAATSWFGIEDATLEAAIEQLFERKGEKVQRSNLEAFRAGKAATAAYRACLGAGIPSRAAIALIGRLPKGTLPADAVEPWRQLLTGGHGDAIVGALLAGGRRLRGGAKVPLAVLDAGGDEAAFDEVVEQA